MTYFPDDRAIHAERMSTRAQALTVECRYCTALPGEECYNRITGAPVHKLPAHLYRLQDAGI